MNLFDVTGKKTIVTGATRGLGRGVLECFLQSGIEVVAIATSDKVYQMVEEYRQKGFAYHGVIGDLSSFPQLEQAFQQSLDLLGGQLDILVNCAGIQRRHPCETFPVEDWQAILDVNLTATFHMCQLAASVMLPKGYGKIIIFASMLNFFDGYTVPLMPPARAVWPS